MAMMPGLFSIGHSNHEWGQFIGLLRQRAIQVLADVRSYPYSRYVPIYSQENLEKALAQADIDYLFLGKELGGRPGGDEHYDADGHVLYSLVARTPLFLQGIKRLEQGVSQFRVALMCSEEDPRLCHRHLLVGKVWHQHGLELAHIRGNGDIETEAELRQKEAQPMLFQEIADQEWRSLKPLRQRSQEGE